MKNTCKSFRFRFRFISTALGLAGALLAGNAKAATSYYFDVNGATTGSGATGAGPYSWEGTDWSSVSAGNVATMAWVDGGFPRFAAGTDAVGSYTVTANSNHTIAGMFMSTGTANTITINGTGILTITATGGPIQGFFVRGGCNMVINSVLGGTGGFENQTSGGTGNGSYFLYGTNTYSGGTLFGTAGGLNINNNSSLGTGPVTWGVAQQVLADPIATSPLTLTNSMTTRAASQLILVTPAAAPITFAGPWTNVAGTITLTLNNAATAATISGVMTGPANAILLKNGPGTLTLTGTNTFAGITTNGAGGLNIAGGVLGGTLLIGSGTVEVSGTGLFSGAITNNASGGVLKLDTATSLGTSTILALNDAGTEPSVNLSFTGTQTVKAIYIDGVSQGSGTYGAIGSSAANQSPIFDASGSGVLMIPSAPSILQQPQSLAAYPDSSATFSVLVTGDPSFTYQWNFNGNPIANATDSSYTIFPVETNNAGGYSVNITNNFGHTNSTSATLSVLATNFYVNTIRGDSPISYWRLDEGSGTVAQDGIGNNNGTYVNVTLGQPGFSLTDTDACIGLPAGAGRGYVSVANFTPFNFNGAFPFTFEGWAYFTNLTGNQRLFSTLTLTAPAGYGFAVVGNNVLRFTTGNVQDADLTIGTPFVTGVWYYLAVTSDGSSYNYYVNGTTVGSVPISGVGSGVSAPLQMGANPPAYTTAEQVNGRLDEMAVYNATLSPTTISNHFNARYGTLAPPVVSAPVATPQTNYVSLSTIIQAVAAGQALSYQWYQGATLLTGQTGGTLTLSSLQLTNAGSYDVVVSNPAGTNTSPSVVITVLPIPTNAAQLNLTSDLVLHLPFDGGYGDISGHNNNGTNVGATTFVSPGAVGASALHYSTASGSTNYVTLGVRPDLQFGSSVDFSVSYWIRQPMGSTFTNLPFFTDAIGSTANGGFAFAPYATATSAGGWMWTVGTVTSPNAATHFPDSSLINDGNWHNLVHVAQRSANLTTYLDGVQVDSQSIVVVGNINTANAATIGQDPTGAYPVMASADIDDLGVWTRTLTPLEVSGLYLAGASNGVSFAVAPVAPLTITSISGTTLSYSGGTGPTYVLLGSSNVAAPVSGWTHVQTNSTSPGSFTIPAVGSGAAQFYLIKNQ